jgi:amino acid permease
MASEGGIMTLPYLVSRTGILWGLVLLAAAFFFAYVMHMMLAELTIGSGAGTQIVSVFSRFLFRGKAGKVLLGAFFVVSVLVMITNLAAYISGGSEVLAAFGCLLLPPSLFSTSSRRQLCSLG